MHPAKLAQIALPSQALDREGLVGVRTDVLDDNAITTIYYGYAGVVRVTIETNGTGAYNNHPRQPPDLTAWNRRAAREAAQLERLVRRFKKDSAAILARLRLARQLTAEAIRIERLQGTPPWAERQYVRPRRVGRACGSRHRVMLS